MFKEKNSLDISSYHKIEILHFMKDENSWLSRFISFCTKDKTKEVFKNGGPTHTAILIDNKYITDKIFGGNVTRGINTEADYIKIYRSEWAYISPEAWTLVEEIIYRYFPKGDGKETWRGRIRYAKYDLIPAMSMYELNIKINKWHGRYFVTPIKKFLNWSFDALAALIRAFFGKSGPCSEQILKCLNNIQKISIRFKDGYVGTANSEAVDNIMISERHTLYEIHPKQLMEACSYTEWVR